MSYNSAALRAVVASIIEEWDGANIEELCDHVLMISSMFKSDCWKSEREYRFFMHGARRDVMKSSYYKVRDYKDKAISYLDLPIQNWDSTDGFPIYRIRVGGAAPHTLATQLTDALHSIGIRGRIDGPNILIARPPR